MPSSWPGVDTPMFTFLNLDYFSIIQLAALILSISISVYLFTIKGKSTSTILLAIAFSGAILFNCSIFLEHASRYYWQPYNLQNLIRPFLLVLGASTAVISFLLFAYYFPRFQKEDKREFKIVLILSAFLNIGIIYLTFYNSVILQRMQSNFQFDVNHYRILAASIGGQFLTVIVLLVRKTIRLSSGEPRSALIKFIKPLKRDSRAARALCIVLLLPLVAVIGYALRIFGILPPRMGIYFVWFVFLLFYFSFIVTYLSHNEERTSFQMKLVGGTLIVMLIIIGIVALIVEQSYERDYVNENFISDEKTIHYTLNPYQSYTITEAPFRFDSDLGLTTGIQYGERKTVELRFPFPFFNRVYHEIHILSGPMIFLGKEIRENGWGGYQAHPVIAPIIMNFDPSAGGEIFLKSGMDKLTITWYEIPEFERSSKNTVQLVLNKDGSFDITYVDINPDLRNRSVKIDVFTTANITGTALGMEHKKGIYFAPRLIGIHPGGRDVPLTPMRFMKNLPYTSTIPATIFEAYDIDYYHYLHNRMVPLAIVLIGASIFILFFFPILFRTNLINPLHMLHQGMEKVNRGDLDVIISPRFNDEIGFLSRSFNRMLQSIKKAESNFRTLAENAQDGILIISRSGVPLYANKSAGEIIGFHNSELMKIRFNEIVRPESGGKITDRFVHKSINKQSLQQGETLIKKRNGKEVPVELTVSNTLWHGKPARVVVLRDITERKRSEEQARQQQQRLMQMDKLTSLGILVAGVAHEINNPNQAILLNASFLKRAYPQMLSVFEDYKMKNKDFLIAGLDYTEFLKSFPGLIEAIEGCSNRIDGIVKSLKAFSQDEPAQIMNRLDINPVIQTAVQLLENYIKKATENFSIKLGNNVPKIWGNTQRLEQAIINLVLNACQALTRRDQAISITSFFDDKEHAVFVIVQDEGIGISEEDLAKITDPFFTTKRDQGGTGLGLYIAETIVKEHTGTISFQSSQGRGTVATISLPVKEGK